MTHRKGQHLQVKKGKCKACEKKRNLCKWCNTCLYCLDGCYMCLDNHYKAKE
jgi:hypothetical protein